MGDREHYQNILGLESPWDVADVELNTVSSEGCPRWKLPPWYDMPARRWRHLDGCQYPRILVEGFCRIARQGGVLQVYVPRAEPGCRYRGLAEALLTDKLKKRAEISARDRPLGPPFPLDVNPQRAATREEVRRRRRHPAFSQHPGVSGTLSRRRHPPAMMLHEHARLSEPTHIVPHMSKFPEQVLRRERIRTAILSDLAWPRPGTFQDTATLSNHTKLTIQSGAALSDSSRSGAILARTSRGFR